jgi:type I restriction enzyme M protein
MVLTLVFLRAWHRDDYWQSSLSSDARDLLRDLRYELGPEIETTASALRDLPGSALSEMIHAVDSIAHRLGDAATFQLVLEGFGARGGIHDGIVFTPNSVAVALTGTIDLASASTVYDPFCRTGELLIAASTEAHAKSPLANVSVYGDTPNSESLTIARMNTRLHQVEAKLGRRGIDGLAEYRPTDRGFSRILTNPPFNASHWTQHYSPCWRYGQPPKSNANFAWLQYAVERLAPGGRAAVIMPNGAAFSMNPRERHIREQMVADGCVEALISLPPALFPGTGVSATIWLLTPPGTKRDEILFADASSAGHMASRTVRELARPEIHEIIRIVEDWRSRHSISEAAGTIPSVAASLPEIRDRDYNLSPSVYFTEPHAVLSRDRATPEIRQLLDRLEAEHESAREKDSIVLRTVRDLTQ